MSNSMRLHNLGSTTLSAEVLTEQRGAQVDVCGFIAGWSPDDPLASESADPRYLMDQDGRFPQHPPAELTALGRRLLGVDRW